MRTTGEILAEAQRGRGCLSRLTTEKKNEALRAMAEALVARTPEILAANAADLQAARGRISEVMLDRLALTAERMLFGDSLSSWMHSTKCETIAGKGWS